MKTTMQRLIGYMGVASFALVATVAHAGEACSSKKYSEAKATSKSADAKTIVETAIAADGFDTLVTAVKEAGLVETLSSDGPFTVFAPTDAAFAALPEGALEAVLADKAKLTAILKHHVVPGKLMAGDVVSKSSVASAYGQPLAINAEGSPTIGGANIVKTDIDCSNGVIHVIDSVLMPKNVVELAASQDDFSTLVAAVLAADLQDTLSGEGPFTIFAPTNAAFAKLPEAAVADLLKPENRDKLLSVLTYHVVHGELKAGDVIGKDKLETVQGSTLDVEVVKNGSGEVKSVKVAGAEILATDVQATNGVIHIIDSVVLPSS